MNIGDKVVVNFLMEVHGVKRDPLVPEEIMVDGKIMGKVGHHYIAVPKSFCTKIEPAHVV